MCRTGRSSASRPGWLLALLLLLSGGCALKVGVRDEAKGPEASGFPRFPKTAEAVREWMRVHANPRDHSLDLASPHPYVETVLTSASPAERVGYFLRPGSYQLGAIVFWLRTSTPAPATLGARAGTWWGLPLFETGVAGERYAPDAHVLIRDNERGFRLPEQPQVDLPEDVPLKTPTRTFHRTHLFAISDGRIWFKRNPSEGGQLREPWRLLGDGLPAPADPTTPFERPQSIAMITADGDDLVAVSDTGRVYLCSAASKSLTSVDGWSDGWGFPGKRILQVDGRATDARALAIGRRAEHALWFEDAIGNRHHFGPMGTTSLQALSADGQALLFTDNGLPNDFSRELCGPQDGRFVAESMSVSASASFLMDRHGRMVTRFDDYDLNGGTPNFEYTYRSVVRPDDRGEDFLTSQTPYFLPLPPWRWHRPPTLEGAARLGRELTILQTGAGNAAREMRVGGLGPDGAPGYFHKGIDEDAWQFTASGDVALDTSRLLAVEDVRAGAADFVASGGRLAQSTLGEGRHERVTLRGTLGRVPPQGTAAGRSLDVELDWNPSCPPASVKVHVGGTPAFEATLHTVDLWTPIKREHPGADGTPLFLLGTLVLPDEVLTDARPDIRAAVDVLRPYHHATFSLVLALDGEHLSLRSVTWGPTRNHPLTGELTRVAGGAPREGVGSRHPRLSEVTGWIRQGELEAAPGWLPRADLEGVEATDRLRRARDDASRLLEEVRELHRQHAKNRDEVARFEGSVRFVFPLLPLGRMSSLLALVSLQTLDREGSLIGSEALWAQAEALLKARLAELDATLANSEAAGATRHGSPAHTHR